MGGGNNNMARCYEGIGNDFPLSSIKSWILLVAYLKQKERNELMRCKEIISVHLQVLSITDFNISPRTALLLKTDMSSLGWFEDEATFSRDHCSPYQWNNIKILVPNKRYGYYLSIDMP